ncbi:MAK10-like protein [Tanacetum coccineum]|uniref:MAK10-like protein n=1 Tax=Tanacetum coccineum TaxID=301880 RepID=A0ABQ4Z0U2_9ASTR
MGDANPIRTLGDYSKPSHEGYKNTIELPDLDQHLKDFLKLVDSLDLDDENRERTRLRLFQFSLHDQASNWIKRLLAGSITTWEDLTTRFLAQFFPPGRTAKLRNDIQMFQQHQGESLSEAWNRFKDLLQKVPHHGIHLWLQVQIFYDNVNPFTRRTIDQSADGKLRDRNAKESWALLEDLALYDNKNVPSTSDRPLIKLENQVQCLMEAHIALTQPTQVNKITTSCGICSGPHDTRYCMEEPEQVFVEYTSSRTDEAGGKWYTFKPEQNNLGDTYNMSWKSHLSFNNQSNLEGLVSNFMASQDARLSKFEADFKQQQSEMTNKIDTVLKAITDRMAGTLPSDTVKNPKLNINSTTSVLSARSYPTVDLQCSSHPSTSINVIKTCSKEANISQTSQLQPGMGSRTQQPEEPEPTLEDVFQDLHLNLPVLEVLAHAPIHNAILDKYVESLKLEWEIARDYEINPFKDVLVFRRMVEFLGAIPINLKSNMWESKDLINNLINWNKPPKNRDGAWHAKIRLIDLDGKEFTKTLQRRSSTWTTSMILDV